MGSLVHHCGFVYALFTRLQFLIAWAYLTGEANPALKNSVGVFHERTASVQLNIDIWTNQGN